MYEKIVKNPLTFSDVFTSEAKSILKGLLTRDPSIRLGTRGADEIKKHPFFAKVCGPLCLMIVPELKDIPDSIWISRSYWRSKLNRLSNPMW
jgi:hypothetical protein